MANLLSVTKSNSIKHLQLQGLSQRQIAHALNVDRKTVRRHLTQLSDSEPVDDDAKGTTAPTGSEVPSDPISAAKSASQCATFAQVIEQKLELGLTAQRIFQDLQIEHAFEGSYWSVRRFIKKLRTEKPQAFRRIEVEPGWEAQVDFGTGAPSVRWSQGVMRNRGIAGHRVLQGLLSLASKYRSDEIEHACEIAWRHGDWQLRTIRKLLFRGGPVQTLMPFLNDHELIRPLSDYDRFVHECVQSKLSS